MTHDYHHVLLFQHSSFINDKKLLCFISGRRLLSCQSHMVPMRMTKLIFCFLSHTLTSTQFLLCQVYDSQGKHFLDGSVKLYSFGNAYHENNTRASEK